MEDTLNQQKQWANALKKQTVRQLHRKPKSRSERQKEIDETLAFHKQKLLEALDKKNKTLVDKHLKGFLAARTEHAVIELAHMQELFGELDENIIDRFMIMLADEATDLLANTEEILSR